MQALGPEPAGTSISMDTLVVITKVEEADLGRASLLVGGDKSLDLDRLGDLGNWDVRIGVVRYPRCGFLVWF